MYNINKNSKNTILIVIALLATMSGILAGNYKAVAQQKAILQTTKQTIPQTTLQTTKQTIPQTTKQTTPHGIYPEEKDIIAIGEYQKKIISKITQKPEKYQHNEVEQQAYKVLNSLAYEINNGDVITDVIKQTQNLATTRFDNGFSKQRTKVYFSRKKIVKTNAKAPTLSNATIYNIRKAISRYRKIKKSGGWEKINEPPLYGQKSPQVIKLRNRLIQSGDLEAGYLNSSLFDSFLKRAVQKFQQRHGLKTTGIVNKNTLRELNVSIDERIQKLKINLLRIKRHNRNKKPKYILVNIPAAQIEAVNYNKMESLHKAVVGQVKRKTPIVNANITSVNFNPKWYIPKSIIKRDLIPILRRRPQYLKKMGIKVYDRKNNEVETQNINWYDNDVQKLLYRQEPGRANSLGLVKIHFPNKHAIFLHDTPEKIIFNELFRAYSSGCVRVQNIRQLVYFLLKDQKYWSKDKIDQYMRNGKTVNVRLAKPVNIVTAYITAWADNNGRAHFRPDIYQRDGIQNLVNKIQNDNKKT